MANPSIRPIGQSGQRLPAGSVTFLFADIEGPTKLAQVFSMVWPVFTLPLVA